ncbi:class I SAM-dependent methyltransferase [Solirubrobacter soli]|uniref:class I SAM-dependent methyltransferase n=1 Tax=Solirubrobacter soli TaxID=363832 RepID=UPI00042089B6|nr:class I SAM-dependent methyltransferase [Solirubrobacter soli]
MPAGDFDYEAKGAGYANLRRTDPRIAARIHHALGDARTVLNVGAGAGSYEPEDRYVVAVEPSAQMRAQRRTPAVNAVAEDLPFDDDSFDAAMATITIHQWPDLEKGLSEMRRVARGPVVILTFDGPAMHDFWLDAYIPELFEAEDARDPGVERVASILGGNATITPVPIPIDCVDGFIEAWYARPEKLLDPTIRAAQSVWAFADPEAVERGLHRLRRDLESGAWDARHGHLRTQPEYIGALRLLQVDPA